MDGSNTTSRHDIVPSCAPLAETLSAGLALFWQAYTYAQDAGADLWDFALENQVLYEAGLTINDLRWLVAKGLAQHGQETTVCGQTHRSFRPSNGFKFDQTTCLVLTPRGIEYARQIMLECASSSAPTAVNHSITRWPSPDDQAAAPLRPRWDPDLRELCLADRVVKRFRVPARNQERILCAFEEEGWPAHIDDPLPFKDAIDPQTRLHDAINRLNRHQANPLLRFHGNGSGSGITWGLIQPVVADGRG